MAHTKKIYRIDLTKKRKPRLNVEITPENYKKLNEIISKTNLTKTEFFTMLIQQVYDEEFNNTNQ